MSVTLLFPIHGTGVREKGAPVVTYAPTLLHIPPDQLLLPPPLSSFLRLHSTAVTYRSCVSVVGVHSLISYHGEVWQEGGTAGGPAVLYLTHRHLRLCLRLFLTPVDTYGHEGLYICSWWVICLLVVN